MGASDPFTVAVAQAPCQPPNYGDAMERACELILDAGQAGARLVVLPEAYVPGYPEWIWTTPFGEAQTLAALKAELLAAAICVPSEATDRLGRLAQRAGVDLVVGVCERSSEPGDTHLYNSLLFLDSAGHLTGRQRQLAPSAVERLIFSGGDGRSLGVCSSSMGALSGLIGADNYLPLARYVLYAAGVQIYVAVGRNTSAAWLAALRHIACEGRIFVIGCGAVESGVIASPDGELTELQPRAAVGLHFGVIDPGRLAAARQLDPEGPLARPDVFQLSLRQALSPVPGWLVGDEPQSPVRTHVVMEQPAVVPL